MEKMPLLFIGHGSPMNAIEDNTFTKMWKEVEKEIPKPSGILVISAHWYTEGTRIMDDFSPKMIYDMYGFPRELYEIEYKAPGAQNLAKVTKKLIKFDTILDNSWGYDHGNWSVLNQMYPAADIPVFQISVDRTAGPQVHYEIGKQIKALRNDGILILSSGNVVHNLGQVNMSKKDGFAFAREFDNYIKDAILNGDHLKALEYKNLGESAASAVPYPDHYYPLLYILGAADQTDNIIVFNEECIMGSLSMTSYLFK